MSRKRCVRRVWRTDIDALELAKLKASLLTPAQWIEQVMPVQTAMDELSRGNWDNYQCWQPMFECLNRIEAMLKLNKRPDHGFIAEVQTVFVVAMKRKTTGATAFRANELLTLRDMVKLYGDLLKEITHKQFADACANTDANMTRIRNDKKIKTDEQGFFIEPTKVKNKEQRA
jgi:hypothetical protein